MLEVHCTGGWPLALSAVHRMFKRSNRFPKSMWDMRDDVQISLYILSP